MSISFFFFHYHLFVSFLALSGPNQEHNPISVELRPSKTIFGSSILTFLQVIPLNTLLKPQQLTKFHNQQKPDDLSIAKQTVDEIDSPNKQLDV